MYALYERLKGYAQNCCKTKPATVHFTFRGNSKSFCGERLKVIYCEYLDDANRGYYGDIWILRRDHIDVAGHQRLTLCGPCRRIYDRRVFDAVAQRAANQVPQITAQQEARPVRDWMATPIRVPGTELMTGHIDEGSIGGLCGEAGIGFKTDYLPWICCMKCLVHFDQYVSEGLMELKGLYITTTGGKT